MTVEQYIERIGKRDISVESYNLDRSSTKKVHSKDHKQKELLEDIPDLI